MYWEREREKEKEKETKWQRIRETKVLILKIEINFMINNNKVRIVNELIKQSIIIINMCV